MRIHGVIADMKSSFVAGGIEAMAQTHTAAVRDCRSYRIFCKTLDLIYPATPLLDIMKNVDRQVGELGIVDTSKAVLGLLPTHCQVEHPERGTRDIRTRPIVVFGKHGSILTPFIVAASLERSDLKMLGASYVAKLGPNVARHVYPVHLPIPTFRRAARKGFLLRIGAWLTAKLDSRVPKDVARERNRASLLQAAEHVRDGGALLIAPDAGNPKARWRTGIGLMLRRLAEAEEPNSEPLLVPYRIWASITGLLHLVSCNPIARLLGKWEYRHPIRIAFGDPFALSDVIEQTGSDPAAITAYLENHYRSLGY
jgi:hypothetical protein